MELQTQEKGLPNMSGAQIPWIGGVGIPHGGVPSRGDHTIEASDNINLLAVIIIGKGWCWWLGKEKVSCTGRCWRVRAWWHPPPGSAQGRGIDGICLDSSWGRVDFEITLHSGNEISSIR